MDISTDPVYVAGTYYCNLNEGDISQVGVGDPVSLVPEPENPYDEYAIRVEHHLIGMIGYIPKGQNKSIAEILKDGCDVNASITETNKGGSRPFKLEFTVRNL